MCQEWSGWRSLSGGDAVSVGIVVSGCGVGVSGVDRAFHTLRLSRFLLARMHVRQGLR